MSHLLPLACGLAAGLVAGLLGVGGGLILVPAMVFLLDVPLKRAVGTSLAAVIAIAAVAVVAEQVAAPENLRWEWAGWLTLGAIPGSFVGAKLVARLPTRQLGLALTVVLVLAAVKISGLLPGLDAVRLPLSGPLPHVAAGFVAGIISALFGIGGGLLAVPLLALFHPEWRFHACRATSLIMIVPTALAGALFHRKLEQLDRALAARLVPGALAGSVAGVVIAQYSPANVLKLLFAIFLLASAFRLGRRSLGAS
ncbi:MAG: sulfite exporter TauE/SafE family protein [Acidobacteriota bacterium]